MKLKAFLKKRGPHTLAGSPGAKISLWGLRAFISYVADPRQVTQVTPCPTVRRSGENPAGNADC